MSRRRKKVVMFTTYEDMTERKGTAIMDETGFIEEIIPHGKGKGGRIHGVFNLRGRRIG